MRHRLTSLFKRLVSDDTGSASVEAVFMLPLLMIAFATTYVLFDGFQEKSRSEKASFVIADMVSREVIDIDGDFIDGARDLFDFMAESDGPTSLRVSQVEWLDKCDLLALQWSFVRGDAFTPYTTQAQLDAVIPKLPLMTEYESIVLVETNAVFDPLFNVGVRNRSIETFVFIRPRFTPVLGSKEDSKAKSDDDTIVTSSKGGHDDDCIDRTDDDTLPI